MATSALPWVESSGESAEGSSAHLLPGECNDRPTPRVSLVERREDDDRDEELWLQGVSERKLQVRRQLRAEGRRVLLRTDLHLRARVCLPARVQLPGDAGPLRFNVMAPARYAADRMNTPRKDAQPPPEAKPTTAAEVVQALLAEREVFVAFVRGRVRSGADAEDIVQQALVKATERATDLRAPERSRAWFFQILRRMLADHHARWALRESKLDQLSDEMAEATPEEIATCACSLGQLERLRPEYAEILRRVDLEDEPLPAAAAALGITVNNATVRLHRARKALREQLRDLCGTESARDCLDCGCD